MTNEKLIWDRLMLNIRNPVGVAAIMGNLMAESSLNPRCMTGKSAKDWDKEQYIKAVNSGVISRETFSNDGIAFGLVQWLYRTRKGLLYDFSKADVNSIGSLETQIRYLVWEMSNYYKKVWRAVTEAEYIAEATDTVMLKYEKPGTTTEAAKEKRREFAIKYYEKYATAKVEPEMEPAEDIPKIRYVVTTAPRLLYRSGNGSGYGSLGRINDVGSRYPWVATSENGWYAIEIANRVAWVSGEYSEVIEE